MYSVDPTKRTTWSLRVSERVRVRRRKKKRTCEEGDGVQDKDQVSVHRAIRTFRFGASGRCAVGGWGGMHVKHLTNMFVCRALTG
jgi:hypothetical protein